MIEDTERATTPLARLLADAQAVRPALDNAFNARLNALAPQLAHILHQSNDWRADWMDALFEILFATEYSADMIDCVRRLFQWGSAHGIEPTLHLQALHALSWAFRDILGTNYDGQVATAIALRETLVEQLARRMQRLPE